MTDFGLARGLDFCLGSVDAPPGSSIDILLSLLGSGI
jgi:hypothetical protein